MTHAFVAGRRVLVTRAEEDSEQWAERLSSLGAEPVVFPCLVTEALYDAPTVAALRRALADAQWLIVTSRRGAAAVAQLLGGPLAPALRIAAVGLATARACVELLGRADFVPVVATSASLGASLGAALGAALGDRAATSEAATVVRVVIAGAVDGRDDADKALAARGVAVTRVDVYRTVPRPPIKRRRDLSTIGIDTVLLASPSAVAGLVNTSVIPDDACVVTIGPTTTAAATAAGLRVTAEARQPTFESMIEAMR